MKVDLNVDIGEGFPHDAELLQYATSANLCCGVHAGSWELTLSTWATCRNKGVRIGAHPGFPDRPNMGRTLPSSEEELRVWLADASEQIERVMALGHIEYIKPHGALYNLLCQPEHPFYELGTAWARAAATKGRLMLLAGSPLSIELNAIQEGFADRRYSPDGTLLSRSDPNAILTDIDVIRAQVMELAKAVDSICIHGDTPGCVEVARELAR